MSKLTKALTLALALPFAQAAMAQIAMAQTATTPAPAADAAKPAAKPAAPGEGLNMGKEVVGQTYVKDTQGDWTVRCTHMKDGNDPCQMAQLLKDDKDNPVADISMVPLPPGGQAVAGATIITPLGTVLSRGITIAIDGNPAKQYIFEWCEPQGCIARIGLTQADLDTYKKGSKATLSIFSMGGGNTPVVLPLSLKGFTAAYDEVGKLNAKLPAPGAPAKKN